MLKERPYELNQKLKRMQASRDTLKVRNREKVLQNKILRDRNVEIIESRDMWKSCTRDLEKLLEQHKKELTAQLESANKEIEETKKQVEKERERANLLRSEIEEIKKKAKILNA